jgi:hypothetical protein
MNSYVVGSIYRPGPRILQRRPARALDHQPRAAPVLMAAARWRFCPLLLLLLGSLLLAKNVAAETACGTGVATPVALFAAIRQQQPCSSIEFRAAETRAVPLSWAAAEVIELAQLLRENSLPLRRLDLSGSVLGDDNAVLLAPALGDVVRAGCRELRLAGVALGDGGLVAVGQELAQALTPLGGDQTGLSLHLADNRITDAGAAALLGFALLHLNELDLSGNQVTDRAARGLLAAVPTSSLRLLDLSRNKLSGSVVSALRALRNRDGQRVDVRADGQKQQQRDAQDGAGAGALNDRGGTGGKEDL